MDREAAGANAFPRAQQAALHKAFVRNVVVGCCLPFASADWDGLRSFHQALEPRCRPCSRTTASRLFAQYARPLAPLPALLARRSPRARASTRASAARLGRRSRAERCPGPGGPPGRQKRDKGRRWRI